MASNCFQLRTPCSSSPCHSWNAPNVFASLLPRRNSSMPCRLVQSSAFSVFRNIMKVERLMNPICSTRFDEFEPDDDDNDNDNDESSKEIAYAVSENTQQSAFFSGKKFSTMKPELLEPSILGIQPEPPIWPEREEILRLSFERRVKSVGIPLSIRMIKKKLQLQKNLLDASGDLRSFCSVKKAFSSMLFIFHQLQNHALQTREESLCLEDLEGVMEKMRVDMDSSFVWLFQKVFWKTPTLMVYVMVLLANFSVFSMKSATPSSIVRNQLSKVGVEVDQDEDRKELELELTEEEKVLWNSMMEEASMLKQKGLTEDTEVLDHETMQRFVAPLSVEIEGDQYEEYVKTELYYQKHLRRSPQNSLLLSNYGHFLYLVAHDNDRAEEYYRRSVLSESPEGEAFSRYGDFLWLVKKDTWAAEVRYLQALEAEPGNTFYVSKYASFLWNTGGESTSFPLEELDNMQL